MTREMVQVEKGRSACRGGRLPGRELIQEVINTATGVVLMLVELDREALELMSATGRVHYYHPG